ncbi:MAG: hypothetical protein V4621_07900 [Pseudomonadota bacterium]
MGGHRRDRFNSLRRQIKQFISFFWPDVGEELASNGIEHVWIEETIDFNPDTTRAIMNAQLGTVEWCYFVPSKGV